MKTAKDETHGRAEVYTVPWAWLVGAMTELCVFAGTTGKVK